MSRPTNEPKTTPTHSPTPWFAGNMDEVEAGVCRIYEHGDQGRHIADAFSQEDADFICAAVNAKSP